jgi:very-short-patch-repair endonuclease
MLIRNPEKLTDEECKYAMNCATHLDFLIYNKLNKVPILAVEVDGYKYHKEGTRQAERDKMKDLILEKYSMPLLRFKTNGSGEKETLVRMLEQLLEIKRDK